MTIVAVQPAGPGHLTAWGLTAQPLASVLNYAGNDVSPIPPSSPSCREAATTSPSSAWPRRTWSWTSLGYFAASSATRLDCTTVQSDVVAVPVNELTAVDALCGPGRTATGGGIRRRGS